ncbi:hypothetical protein SLS63_006944 [Diaporthe eres]|uniref:USP domain-containing protein n=1 Tax=Diaporthe eres TaxID=83184 RepID=A0ABR1P792_DIAER
MATRPQTPASPKNVKINSPVQGIPVFGCEHAQRLLSQSQETTNTCIQHYKAILRSIFDNVPIIPQMRKDSDGKVISTLTSNYLCLQCPAIEKEETMAKHGTKKSHRFCRKRKYDELLAEAIKEDPKIITANTIMPSCRADGLRGIYNAGATCYQNVILQSFLHNPILRNFYLSDGHSSSNCEVPHCLSCAMDDMFQDFWGSEVTNGYTAANILSSFWISENKAFENLVTTKEQDAHEFFQFLAEELHERNGDGKRPEIGSEHSCNCIIHQTYYGKLQTTTTCQNCGGVTNQVQSFLDLSVGLENLAQKRGKKASHGKTSMTLQECLEDEYVKSDKCEYRCNKCDGTQQARRNTSIKRLPNVLSIQLKRFEFRNGTRDKSAAKIETQVNFPLQLNMLPYTNRARNADAKETYELSRSCTYDLMCAVVHVGEIDTGHYICYCRVGEQWFTFNDHRVELASKADVLAAKAYLLFYIVRTLA